MAAVKPSTLDKNSGATPSRCLYKGRKDMQVLVTPMKEISHHAAVAYRCPVPCPRQKWRLKACAEFQWNQPPSEEDCGQLVKAADQAAPRGLAGGVLTAACARWHARAQTVFHKV